ncbi:MAG: Spx/MgsR family RNA polymerase-binding regulatory protein [Saccharofermentans sp.]|nr:Spx/MgsR family RNA polymerase-binding regulatory protein [Saccharofermentans sp.]
MVKVYCYPKCSTCRKAIKYLSEQLIDFTLIDIKEDNPDKKTLKKAIDISGLPIRKLFNTSGNLYKEMNLSTKLPSMTEEEMIEILSSDGMLVKRPLLITDEYVLVGFKEDSWEDIIRILRIKQMEERFDRRSEEDKKILSFYNETLWKDDFEADEKGLIPKDMKRGVLSEDGLYNLLQQ